MKTKFWILGCVLFMACGGSDERPDGILSHEDMVAILIDTQIAQTRVNNLRLKNDSAQKVYNQYHEYLLTQHDIDDSTFYKSLQYYLNKPSELDIIHEGVLDTLNFRLQKVEAQQEKDKADKEAEKKEKEEEEREADDANESEEGEKKVEQTPVKAS